MPRAAPSAAPRLSDYPRHLVDDGRPGAERRRTIDDADAVGLPGQPLVSIVTVVFNNARHVERAMRSVFAQSYRHIEYIVVDGGSTDGTVDVVRRHAERLSYWHSAPDAGIADAFNRGVALARGDFVGLVNSDDWMSPDQVERAVAVLTATGAPFVFGDLIFYRADDGTPVYRIAGDPDYATQLWHRMPQVTHPTTVVRRDVYERYGVFDSRWRIAMDYDWLYRLHNAGVHGVHDRSIVGHMSLGGVSDRDYIASLDEQRTIARKNGSPTAALAALYFVRRGRRRVRQVLDDYLPAHLVGRLRRLINPALSEVRRPSD